MCWILCQVYRLIAEYDFTKEQHAEALYELAEVAGGEYDSDEDEAHYDEHLEMEIAHAGSLQGLFQRYQRVVRGIPILAADILVDVYGCELVFRILDEYQDGDMMMEEAAASFFSQLHQVCPGLHAHTGRLFQTTTLSIPGIEDYFVELHF